MAEQGWTAAAAAADLLEQFSASSTDAVAQWASDVRADSFRAAYVVREMSGQASLEDLAAVMAAHGVLLEAAGRVGESLTAWTLARSALVEPNRVAASIEVTDQAIDRLSRAAGGAWAQPLAGWPTFSVSVRSATYALLRAPALPTGPDVATSLRRNHEGYGDGLLGAVQLDVAGDRRRTTLGWLAPAVSAYLGTGQNVDTRAVLLVLADCDPTVRAALASNGSDATLEAELVRSGRPRRHWTAQRDRQRLVAIETSRAPQADVTFAVPGADAIMLESLASPLQTLRWSGTGDDVVAVTATALRLPPTQVPVSDVLAVWMATSRRVHVVRTWGVESWVDGREHTVRIEPAPVAAHFVGLAGDVVVAAILRGDGLVDLLGLAQGSSGSPAPTSRAAASAVVEVDDSLPIGTTRALGPDQRAVAVSACADDGATVIVVAHTTGIVGWWPDDDVVRPIAPVATHATIRCLAAGQAGAHGVVVVGTDFGADIWSVRTGLRIAAIEHPRPIVDCDWGELDGRSVFALTDADGVVDVWDLDDLTPLTSSTSPIAGAATARFAVLGDAAQLVVRTVDGGAERRRLAFAVVVEEVPPYHSDDVRRARDLPIGGGDPLRRESEADAIAEVVTSRSVAPPLAVGLFGEWGEGKSYFMERIARHVRARSEGARLDPAGPTCTHVRQVRFNAWHYAETDLWASVVAELFDQLSRSDDPATTDQDQQAAVSALRAALVRQTRLKARLDDARQRRALLEAQVAERLRQAPAYDQLGTTDRAALEAMVPAEQAKVLYEGYCAGRRAVPGLWRRGRAILGALAGRGWLLVGLLTAVAVLGLLVAVAAAFGGWGWWTAAGAAVLAAAPAVRSATHVASEAQARLAEAWQLLRDAAERAASSASAETRLLIVQRDVTVAEVDELQAEYDRVLAAGQLAGLLEQRLKDGTYRSRLGLMSQIRRDFVEMASLLVGDPTRIADDDVAAAQAAGVPAIERIVLYIDDLDRCPPDRVVQVLEAIHLLLAVPLFIVVVAVDPRWLHSALTTHYRQLLADPDEAGGDDELWRTTPMHYLEKIFQIPFTLSPLDVERYRRLVDELIPPAAGAPDVDTAAAAGPVATPLDGTTGGSPEALEPSSPYEARIRPFPGTPLPPPPLAEERDPLVWQEAERQFLKMLGPPLVTTPRSVKRLVNSYGLLLALRGRDERARIVGPTSVHGAVVHPHRAALTLLGAVIGAPEAAPEFFANLHREDADVTWREFLDRQLEYGQDLSRLATVLGELTDTAAAADAPLPPLVRHWREWIVPCGRLSFQTGRVVVRLGVAVDDGDGDTSVQGDLPT